MASSPWSTSRRGRTLAPCPECPLQHACRPEGGIQGHPGVDSIDNLSAAIIVDQKRIGGNSRSTVGTITDIFTLLRLLFSRVGKPFVGYSNVFSFNDPQGMCPDCEGIGKAITLDLDKKLSDYSNDEWQALLYGEGKVPFEWQGGSINTKYEGLVDKFTRLYIKKDGISERNREVMLRFVTTGVCQSCGGTRLNEAIPSARRLWRAWSTG